MKRGCTNTSAYGTHTVLTGFVHTKLFAYFVGRRCRISTIKDVAQETHLNGKTVKELEQQYMREQLHRAGRPAPRVIGIDEVSISKGHT